MARLVYHSSSDTPKRKLQIRVIGKRVEVVDKETQQLIAGVANWEVNHSLYILSGRTSVRAKIEIVITDPADIFVEPDEVESTIVDAPLSLPAPVLVISEESAHVSIERKKDE